MSVAKSYTSDVSLNGRGICSPVAPNTRACEQAGSVPHVSTFVGKAESTASRNERPVERVQLFPVVGKCIRAECWVEKYTISVLWRLETYALVT